MRSDSKVFFAETPPVRLFFRAAVPGVISMVSMSLYSILEGIFVGQFCGELAFAAMNLAMPFVIINFALSDLIGVGSSIPISIAHGQQNDERANGIFSLAFFLILASALCMGLIMYRLAPLLMGWMGAEGELYELSVRYLRLNAMFCPFTSLIFSMDNYLRVCGFVRGSMLLNIFMSLLQIAFLTLFVAILRWELLGAGLAINLGMACCAVLALIPFLLRKTRLQFVKPRFSWSLLREIAACGSPVFFNNIAGRLTAIVLNALLLRRGGATAVATYSILMYASELIWPMLYGMCDSLQPAIGYNWGARALDRVKALTRCMFTASAIVSVLASTAVFLFPSVLVSFYVDSGDLALREMAAHALRLYCLGYLFRWFGFSAQTFFNAIKRPFYSSLLTLCNTFVFPMLLVFALWPLGLDGIWLNQPGSFLLVALLAFVLLQKTRRMLAAEEAAQDSLS